MANGCELSGAARLHRPKLTRRLRPLQRVVRRNFVARYYPAKQ